MSDKPWGARGDLDHLRGLADALGYAPGDLGRLAEAFTHTSFANESTPPVAHNERLEFLGDAVLDLVVAEALMDAHGDLPEGDLSRLRASLVSSRSLAGLAGVLEIGSVLRLGRGEVVTGGRLKDSLIADAYEAMVGAVYVDLGLEAARHVILEHLGERIASSTIDSVHRDYKTILQEWCQAARHTTPVYRVIGESGPDHNKEFLIQVTVAGSPIAQGKGRSKKQAERAAAHDALRALEQKGESGGD